MRNDIDIKLGNFKNYLKFYRYCHWYPETKSLLRENKKFSQKYSGERCFILGNGPSLKCEDLSVLKDEYVFTVNQSVRLPQFKELKSNFHFWADPNFFRVDKNKPEDMEMLNTMMTVNEDNPNLQCFCPVQNIQFIKDFEIDKKLNMNYFYSTFTMYENYDKEIDYTKPGLGFGTVVQWCITMAIYMGFSEIYILGCDNTGIITNIKSICQQNDDDDYGYEMTENEKKRMEAMLSRSSLEAYLRTYLLSVKDYRRLYQYCSERNIKLVNCSAQTAIDSIPRKRLTDVIAGK